MDKLNQSSNPERLSLPLQSEIDEQIAEYSIIKPYNGNKFYDEIALNHYKAGIDWLLSKIKGGN